LLSGKAASGEVIGVIMQSLQWFLSLALAAALAVPGARAADEKLPWGSDLQKTLEAARKSGKKVFIDFTGDG